MSKKGIKRICLWSGPRNISTAIMYSFAQRKDTLVFDEPLYGYYLTQTNARTFHPGAEEIINQMETKGDDVIKMMMNEQRKPVLFFKHMTHHLINLDRSFLKDVTNIILTRNPKEMLPSFAKVIPNPSLKDVAYELNDNLYNKLTSKGVTPIILDATKLLNNPEKIIKQLCDAIGISFDINMLNWEAGARSEDGIWAKYWYDGIHQSKGFNKYTPKTSPFPEELRPLLNKCLPFYYNLEKLALK